MPEPSLTAAEVAALLRDLRTAAGLTVVDAAKAAGIAQSTLTRYEGGKFVPKRDALEALVAVYRPDRATRTRLLGGAREAQPRYRRVVMHRGAAAAQIRIGDLERDAVRQLTVTPTMVPGLLQTERYMRAIAGTGLAGDELEQWVRNRLDRQRVLEQPGHEFVQVVTAGALLWCAGSADVMREQFERLGEVAALPSVQLGVIPPARPAAAFPLHGFDVYEFSTGRRQIIVGTHGGVVTITDQQGVDEYMALWSQLVELADFDNDAASTLAELFGWYA